MMVLNSQISHRSVSMGKQRSILTNLVSNERELDDFDERIEVAEKELNMNI